MKVGDAVRLKRDSLLHVRLASFANDVGYVVDICQDNDDDGLRMSVRFPD